MKLTTITGLLLIAVPLAFNITLFLLQRAFEYPDMLRKPTDHILSQFKQGGASLRRLWYAFTLAGGGPWSAARIVLIVVQCDLFSKKQLK